jgi:hypothetical protein
MTLENDIAQAVRLASTLSLDEHAKISFGKDFSWFCEDTVMARAADRSATSENFGRALQELLVSLRRDAEERRTKCRSALLLGGTIDEEDEALVLWSAISGADHAVLVVDRTSISDSRSYYEMSTKTHSGMSGPWASGYTRREALASLVGRLRMRAQGMVDLLTECLEGKGEP